MDDLLSFITSEVKEKNISMDNFLKNIEFNKSKFYRAMKFPEKLNLKDVENISQVLNFTQSKKELFKKIISTYLPDSEFADEVIKWVFKKSNLSAYESNNKFECYEKDNIYILTSDKLSAKILSNEEINKENNKFIEVEIFNSFTSETFEIIYHLLFQIYEKIENKNTLKILQYINIEKKISEQLIHKFKIISTIAPMSIFDNYNLDIHSVEHLPTEMRNNRLLIKIYEHNDDKRNSIIKFTNYIYIDIEDNGNAKCYFSEGNIPHYDFFRPNIETFKKNANTVEIYNEKDNINELFLENTIKFKKMLIKYDFSYDNISEEVFNQYYSRIMSLQNKDEILKNIATIIDPKNKYIHIDAESIVKWFYETIIKRFKENNKQKSVNILSVYGIKSFAESYTISDMIFENATFPSFTKEEVKNQLQYIINCINYNDNDSNSSQQYFIANTEQYLIDMSIIIWREYGINVGNDKCQEKINSKVFYKCTNLSNAMYDFFEQLIYNDKYFMDEKEAITFLTNLIKNIN